MTSEANVEAVQWAVAALNDGDVDGYLSRFDPSCRRWVAGISEPLPLPTVAENLRLLGSAFEHLRLEEEAIFGRDDRVCARWCLRGEHASDFLGLAATGREIAVHSCEVYAFGGNQVREVWTYQDPVELIRQIGAGDRGMGDR